jgi:hypothetical protein
MAVVHEVDPTDPLSDQPIRCEIELHPSGMIMLLRSPGCTQDDLVDLCRAVSGGDVPVRDITADTAADIGRGSEEDQ